MIEDRPLPPGFPKFEKATRPWACKAGNEDCTRKVPCRSCLGRRNRRSGLAKQRVARKALGVPDAKFHGQLGNEENWRGPLRFEVKSGQLARSAATRYIEAERQAEANKAVGDARPLGIVLMPKEWPSGEGLVMVRLSVWQEFIVPMFEEVG